MRRPIAGFPGYEVGEDSSVWSCWKNGGNDRTSRMTDCWHRIKGWIDRRRGQEFGYAKIGLMRDGRLHHLKLHRVVLEAFVGPCPSGMESRHLNDDKSDNSLKNLAWGTQLENANDCRINRRYSYGVNNPRAKLTLESVSSVREQLSVGRSERKIAEQFGVSKGTIRSIKIGKTWKDIAVREFPGLPTRDATLTLTSESTRL